jgi:hypothetical protein
MLTRQMPKPLDWVAALCIMVAIGSALMPQSSSKE